MTKEWKCTQCGNLQTRSIVTHVSEGAPEECEVCGNDEFEETTMGGTHSVLDSVLP
jgi:predicted nucleic-acid-binding Zn-ribbon protein